ncbi:MarR family transcriptional regulator [Streptomyces sp. B-S-A8]|uniref:MarR family transcriptional regulator n=1 Tax=Streptomyces solicavernae TaxID=3043614 RepID=A0ABT6RVR2_9ACTN|nr:MarR family transcriptional regulator [Streptomyces sp. B-S-A8]MDI3387833.1 MarR family transcriptional regulator [Streptomyces sp. B-S-A8]
MSLQPSKVREQWALHNPGLDTSPMEVVVLVKRASALLDRALEPLYDGASLTAPELDLLIPLRYAHGPVIARSIADHMNLSQAGVSKALSKLERRGYIERNPNPADRRAALVTVTSAGQQAVDHLFPRQLGIEAEMFAGLGQDRGAIVDALTRLVAVMERHVADDPQYQAHTPPGA